VGVDFVGSDAEGQRASGWQPTLSGAGSLDEDNRRHLSFSLRGPDARDRGSLGVADEYWVRYSQGTMTATLGDDTYGLSMLTEPGRYGSGGLFGFQRSRWGLSTYHMRDRLGGSGTEQSGLNTYYWLSRDTRVDVNLLDKQGGELAGTIESLRSETRWAPWLSTDFEAAQSDGDRERGRAYRGSLQGSAHGLRYYALGWRADPGYRGYLRDKKYVSAGFDLPRRQGWGLRGYYRLQDWNLEEPEDLPLDPRRAPNLQDLIRFAPTEQQASLGTEHSLGRATRFTLDYNLRKRADGHSTPQLDLMSRSVRAGLGRSWKSLSFLYSIERGITRDEILARQFDTTFHMLSGSWRASPTQTYGFYGFRDENARANEPQPPQTTFGVSANYVIGVATSLSLNAQQNDTQTRRGGQYNVALRHERPDGGRFTLIGRRIKGRITQTDVMLTYSAPLGLPVARKADVGSLGGRVYDSETGAGLRSVLLNLDGLTAVTDDNGNFTFPVVKANTYRLSMDRANVAVDKVPVESFPLDVSVTAHELRQVQVALIRTVTISVTVKQRVSSTNGINGVPESSPEAVHGVQNALVTLSRGDIVYRRLTDAEGRVKLGGLPPGTWTVTLAGEGIPAGYTSAAREQQLEVPPGTAAATEFELTPIRRDIRMLPPLQVHR
jgi:hypothetical protein